MTTARPRLDPIYQVDRLRYAAACLRSAQDASDAGVPEGLCPPLRGVLREAADRIEVSGRTLGQPVNYALQIAGVILGEDLGHNR